MTETAEPDSRSALGRARFFLVKAQTAPAAEREAYEAYLDAAIVFARAALHRTHKQFHNRPWFKAVWDSLLNDDAVNFFRLHRNGLLKEAPTRVGQKIVLGAGVSMADELYFFESGATAAQTVAKHLARIEAIVQRCHRCEELGFDVDDDIPFDTAMAEGLAQRKRATDSYEELRQSKFDSGKQCFQCHGSGVTASGETCLRCRGLGYRA